MLVHTKQDMCSFHLGFCEDLYKDSFWLFIEVPICYQLAYELIIVKPQTSQNYRYKKYRQFLKVCSTSFAQSVYDVFELVF